MAALIGQPCDEPKYFWGRPSATGADPYNAFDAAALAEVVQARIDNLRAFA